MRFLWRIINVKFSSTFQPAKVGMFLPLTFHREQVNRTFCTFRFKACSADFAAVKLTNLKVHLIRVARQRDPAEEPTEVGGGHANDLCRKTARDSGRLYLRERSLVDVMDGERCLKVDPN